jgi:hypothetical protein
MDEKTREKVRAIAKSLKELHLVANEEEAEKRAKEIVTAGAEDGKPIKELFAEAFVEKSEEAEKVWKESEQNRETLGHEAHEVHKSAEHNIIDAKESKENLEKTKEQLQFDKKMHSLEKSGVEDATKDVDELDCAVKDAEFIVKEADKVQKKKK